MSRKAGIQTRSSLSIDAVAKAAAKAGGGALLSQSKIGAIAGLAGFVLRLFRQKACGEAMWPAGPADRGRRLSPGRGAMPARKGGRRHG